MHLRKHENFYKMKHKNCSLGGFCPGSFCQGVFVGGVLSGGICPGGFCPRNDANMSRTSILKTYTICLKILGLSIHSVDSNFRRDNKSAVLFVIPGTYRAERNMFLSRHHAHIFTAMEFSSRDLVPPK